MMKLGQMFKSHMTRDMLGRSGAWDGSYAGAGVQTNGFMSGTQVATSLGWSDVSDLKAGDMVLTFDDGLQKITRIERSYIGDDITGVPMQHWPLRIPKGALGNATEMTLMPEQAVMLESNLGEAMFGDPFTLVPACALEGYKGIERMNPRAAIEVIMIHFETPQVVFGNIGALMYCPAAQNDVLFASETITYAPEYSILSMTDAACFVAALQTEADQDAIWTTVASGSTASHVA